MPNSTASFPEVTNKHSALLSLIKGEGGQGRASKDDPT